MTLSMAGKFAIQNLKANRFLEIPFILSSGVMSILFNITASLSDNRYVQTRHASLPMLIGFTVAVVAIFTVIFVIYATNFLLKRRNKEFALYGILGLEKKHIRKIISIEFFVIFIIIAAIAVSGGYIFGQLTFLGLNRLMKDMSGGLMDYPFSTSAMVKTMMLVFILYIFTVLRSSFNIYVSTPVSLLEKQYSGEGEPKSRVIIMIFGFTALAVGYYIALTVKGVLSSLAYFFLAALSVILATYLLYISFSVIILKARKKRKNYYTPTKFLMVSGLLYRMKSNAVSLASISILSAGVIITLSTTATIYSNIQITAENMMPRDYKIESSVNVDENNYIDVAGELKEKVETTVSDKSQITDDFTSFAMMMPSKRVGNEFKEFTKESSGSPDFILMYDLNSYNTRTDKHVKLKDDEVLLCANQSNMADMEHVTIGERTFKARKIENITPSNYAVEVYGIIVKDFDTMQYISGALKTFNRQTEQMENTAINCTMDWNVSGISTDSYKDRLKELQKETGYEVDIYSEYVSSFYEMNGGFLFLGIVIGLIFLTGTILITYYKQINEGYEDREKYQIMKKVGLSDELIKKTSSSQIGWMFYAPLIIAIIHCIVASKIVYQLLGLFAIKSFVQYGTFAFSVIAVFFVVYFMIFKLTSRAYYRMVK